MLFLFITGFIFLFISTTTGFLFNCLFEKKDDYSCGIFKAVLTGTLFLTVYLSICSIFMPTNFWLLIPPFILSVIVFFLGDFLVSLRKMISRNVEDLLAKEHALVTFGFVAVLLFFTIVPPYNTDSGGYHFLAILWNEKFSVVPGLANLFPQYGYNSSFFVLSAAFSFTDIFHQSIYPINAVLTILFFLWLLKKSYACKDFRRFVIWLMLFIFLRQFPINLASPSADSLASILVFYIFITLSEKDLKNTRLNYFCYLFLLAAFAITIKLSTAPLVLVFLVPFIYQKQNFQKIFIAYLHIVPLFLLIILPWLLRSIILSGYLIFPFPAIDLFSYDWKVPLSVAVDEKLHISQGPRMVDGNWAYVSTLSFFTWFPIWWAELWKDNHFNFLLVNFALLSPVLMIPVCNKNDNRKYGKKAAFSISYFGIWFWMFSSPDIRFGYHFLVMSIVLPMLVLLKNVRFQFANLNKIFVIITAIACLYYCNMAFHLTKPKPVSASLIRPFKCPEYYKNNDLSSFRYVMLNNNIKLYIHDSLHHSINAPLPSCFPYRTGIVMRGNNLQDGFKTQP